MSFLSRLFGQKPQTAHSRRAQSDAQPSIDAPSSLNARRRELLRVVLRDTLNRHGIPAGWMTAEVVTATSRTGERGVHWRLIMTQWEPRLLTHALAFQQSLTDRLATLDPMASTWLLGVSWQFAVPDETVCAPMPHASVWTARPVAAVPAVAAAAVAVPAAAAPEPAPAPAPAAPDNTRADLEQLFAIRDADFNRHAGADAEHEATQPMYLGTEPAKLQ